MKEIAEDIATVFKAIGEAVKFVVEHLNLFEGVLTSIFVGKLIGTAIDGIRLLTSMYQALAAKILLATEAQTAFNLSASGKIGMAAAGAGLGSIAGGSGGQIGGAIGGAAGQVLGGMIGQALIPIPGVGYLIGSAAGAYVGGMAGGAIERSFTTNVTVNLDPTATAKEVSDKVAEKVQPVIAASHARLARAAENEMMRRRTAAGMGGR